MRKFNIKSIILGIGIGIIITSFISIIYLAGRDMNGTLSKEEIIKQARELGMVKPEEVAKDVTDKTGQIESSDDLKTTKISD